MSFSGINFVAGEPPPKALLAAIKNVPFNELQELRGVLGSRRFDALLKGMTQDPERKDRETDTVVSASHQLPPSSKSGGGGSGGIADDSSTHTTTRPPAYAPPSKTKPVEVSSKSRRHGPRRVIASKVRAGRDPRFDDLSGTLNKDLFRKSYAFLDSQRDKEMAEVRKRLKKTRDPEEQARLQALLQSQKDRLKQNATDVERAKRKREHRQAVKEVVAKGGKPYYLKSSDEKRLELLDKFKKLREQGRVEGALKSKRKRNQARDGRNMPGRRGESENY